MADSTTINGKRVTLKSHIPLKDGHAIPKLLMQAAEGDLTTQVEILRIVVESWENPGSPTDAESYENLDVFSDILPMATWADTVLGSRMNTGPKATENGSSSDLSSTKTLAKKSAIELTG